MSKLQRLIISGLLLTGAAAACLDAPSTPANSAHLAPTIRTLAPNPEPRTSPQGIPTLRPDLPIEGPLESIQEPDPTLVLEPPPTPAPTPTFEILGVTPGPTRGGIDHLQAELPEGNKIEPTLRARVEARMQETRVNESDLKLSEQDYAFIMITTETAAHTTGVIALLEEEGSIEWQATVVRRDGRTFARVEAIVHQESVEVIQATNGVALVEGMTGAEVVPLVRQGPEELRIRNRKYTHISVETTNEEAAREIAEEMGRAGGSRIANAGKYAYGTVELETVAELAENPTVVGISRANASRNP